jgi:succinate dehydrogenase / fumarate reductase, membrane anchor subunit
MAGTELGEVRGVGSARAGTHHWTTQRLTAIGNFALVIWLLATLISIDLGSHGSLVRWLSSPAAAIPLILLVISAVTHIRLGLTVLIEDYAHSDAGKFTLLTLLNLVSWTALVSGLFFIAKLAFAVTGAPNAG